jgi:hypothetical protein
MIAGRRIASEKLFNMIVIKGNENDASRQGWIFETLAQILIALKCVKNIDYTEISEGQLQNLKKIKNINSLLNLKIGGGGGNKVDMTIKRGPTLIPFSFKYKNKYGETDVSTIDNIITKQKITDDYTIGLIVRDKGVYTKHRYNNDLDIDKQLIDKIIKDGLLFDENDIIQALDVFRQRFQGNKLSLKDFIEMINADYLSSPRQQLVKKLHQRMTEVKFIESFSKNKHTMWCIAHKPRSGKSITLLLLCKYLLAQGYKKILVTTSVKDTINSFTSDLDKYIDFKDINYMLQGNFDETRDGIFFCSVQYLKCGDKKDLLKRMGFDAILIDESHQGSSTDKTKSDILDVEDTNEIRKNIKLTIFASGTADKTKKYYGIHGSCVYEWEIEDEAHMKEGNFEYMTKRHGKEFSDCLQDTTLNADYSKHPTQVLMKHSIPESLIDEINAYNTKHGTTFGYNCSSLTALRQIGKDRYAEEFELCKTNDGVEILKEFLDCIISQNRMRDTIMKQVESIQSSRGSRKSSVENPLLFLVYLPTHTGNSTISLLQKTFKKFLEDHKLWTEYNIEYSNSVEDTGCVKEEYNKYIQTIMDQAKRDRKRGCILLLGNKGGVGITYNDCDVTISLDDGHNLDNQRQRFARALTEAGGKTIGINVDMNIQRTYLYLIDVIQKHRRSSKMTKTNAEILYYLYEHNIFLFDPQHFKNGKMRSIDIQSYYKGVAENILNEIDDKLILEDLVCGDVMRDFIKKDFRTFAAKNIDKNLEGDQQDCPKGDKEKFQIDTPKDAVVKEKEVDTTEIELLINQTYEMCKSFLFPLLALISRSYKVFDFKEIFTNGKTKTLILSLLEGKINLKNPDAVIHIMNTIMDNNDEIINNIREIYTTSSSIKVRQLIEKHFIPTREEKKLNAEVPTPVKLVEEMLDMVPPEFWKTPKKVFEPCCGKGNFVLGIFDRFYKGLMDVYPDETERCRVISSECIHYADITPLNIFITTEILKCHAQSYCGSEELDFVFHSYVGDTLKLDVSGFNAVIGNPPYQSNSEHTKNSKILWGQFVSHSIDKWLVPNGYLVFVHPALWRKPNHDLKIMMFSKQIHKLSIHSDSDGTKMFGATTRFDYYLLENRPVYTKTRVLFEDKKECEILITNDLPFIPNFGWSLFQKVFAKFNNNGMKAKSSSKLGTSNKNVSDVRSDEHKFELFNSSSKTKGLTYRYSKVEHEVQKMNKVLFSNGRHIVPFYDNGTMGITQGGIYIQVNNEHEGNKLVDYLNSKLLTYLMKASKWSNFETSKQLFWYIPFTTDIGDVNTYFELTPEEIGTIG